MIMNKRIFKTIMCLFLILVLSFMSISLQAKQVLTERRVYYLDATYSMVSNKLWEPCKMNLIKAIENVDNVNTELVVVVFADDVNPIKKVWKKWEQNATYDGKAELVNNINNLVSPVRTSMTNLYDPLVDFYSEAKTNRVNYMFLMTDGGHEQGGDFFDAIDNWKHKTSPLTYGFLVELTDKVGPSEIKARDKARKHIDMQKDRLWRVSTADVNINLIRLERTVKFNVRGDSFVDIPIFFSGKDRSCVKNLTLKLNNHNGFRITKTDISDDNIRVFIDKDIDIHRYPTNSTIGLDVKLSGSNDKTFLLTKQVDINCLNKKEKTLFLSESNIRGTVDHYDSFGWVEAKTMPCCSNIDFNFSQDALSDPNACVEFELIVKDDNDKLLPSSTVVLFANGNQCKNNRIRVDSSDKQIKLSISFLDKTEEGVYYGYFKPIKCNLDRIGNVELNEMSYQYPLTLKVRYSKSMNPLAKLLMLLCIVIVLGLFIWFVFLRPILFPHFKKFRKTVLINQNGNIIAQLNVNFKGAKKVVFATQEHKQSIINRIFTGKIITKVHPAFEEPIIFIPKGKKKAILMGRGYIFNPNPILQNGIAEIKALAKKMTINIL